MPEILSADESEAREAKFAKDERDRADRALKSKWEAFVSERGSRYADCRLGNFEANSAEAQKAIAELTAYCQEIGERIKAGDGVLLYGPKGTGKDHLASALARAAIFAGKAVVWQNGMDLFGDIRDRMETGDSERRLVKGLINPDVLYISDPVPPIGRLTDFQALMLFRVLDGRYSRRKATWVTLNVSSAAELDERMGPQNGDRLRDGAMAIFCNWQSYRKVKQ